MEGSWPELMQMLIDGEARGFVLTPPVMSTDIYALVSNADSDTFQTKEQVTAAQAGTDPNAETIMLDHFPGWRVDYYPHVQACLKAVDACIAKCIELAEDRELIRYTERDKLTGLLNKDCFFRYVNRLNHIYKETALDAVICDVNRFHSANKQYGRQFGDHLLHSIGDGLKKLARETGGIVCREAGDTFLLYCPHQDDYEQMFREFLSVVLSGKENADKGNLRFGVFPDARQEPDRLYETLGQMICKRSGA